MACLTLEDRFWSKVEKTDTYWLWKAYVSKKGYGQFGVNKKEGVVAAHRVAYTLVKGDIPRGLVIDHLCRVRHCVNPDHMEPVTIAENNRRGFGIAMQQVGKTHCIAGHEFTADNLLPNPLRNGYRECRECARRRGREHMHRKRAELKVNA